MVCAGSIIRVTDNTGARLARCIRVLGKWFGIPGDMLVVSIRGVVSETDKVRFKKGDIFHGVLVRSRKRVMRECGSSVLFNDNAVVLVDKKGVPLGSRVMGPIAWEVRDKGYKRIVALAMVTI